MCIDSEGNTTRCFIHGDGDYEIEIKSELSENFVFPVSSRELRETISFFMNVDDDVRSIIGIGKRELITLYEDTLPELNALLSELSEQERVTSILFQHFCTNVITYEVLKLIEDREPLDLLVIESEARLMQ